MEKLGEEDPVYEKKAGLYFKKEETVEVEFENNIKLCRKLNYGVGWNQASTELKRAYISGQIAFEFSGNNYKSHLKKRIRKLQWQFWNEKLNESEEFGKKLFYFDECVKRKNGDWLCFLQI